MRNVFGKREEKKEHRQSVTVGIIQGASLACWGTKAFLESGLGLRVRWLTPERVRRLSRSHSAVAPQAIVAALPANGQCAPAVECFARLAARTKLIILLEDAAPDAILRLIHAGVAAILEKNCRPEEIGALVTAPQSDEIVLSRCIANTLVPEARSDQANEARTCASLSKRQAAVLALVAAGRSNKDIADELEISRRTVENEWFKIQASDTPAIVATDRIYDSAATNPKFYYMPSLAVNVNGDMVVGFSGSSASEYISAYYSGRLSNGYSPSGPIRYFEGKNSFQGSNGNIIWGDYSYTSLDPDGSTIWTIQEYADYWYSGSSVWGTRIGAISPF